LPKVKKAPPFVADMIIRQVQDTQTPLDKAEFEEGLGDLRRSPVIVAEKPYNHYFYTSEKELRLEDFENIKVSIPGSLETGMMFVEYPRPPKRAFTGALEGLRYQDTEKMAVAISIIDVSKYGIHDEVFACLRARDSWELLALGVSTIYGFHFYIKYKEKAVEPLGVCFIPISSRGKIITNRGIPYSPNFLNYLVLDTQGFNEMVLPLANVALTTCSCPLIQT